MWIERPRSFLFLYLLMAYSNAFPFGIMLVLVRIPSSNVEQILSVTPFETPKSSACIFNFSLFISFSKNEVIVSYQFYY